MNIIQGAVEKTINWPDFMAFGDKVADEIRSRFRVTNVFSARNYDEIIAKINDESFDQFPCIFVLAIYEVPTMRYAYYDAYNCETDEHAGIRPHRANAFFARVWPHLYFFDRDRKNCADMLNEFALLYSQGVAIKTPFFTDPSYYQKLFLQAKIEQPFQADRVGSFEYGGTPLYYSGLR